MGNALLESSWYTATTSCRIPGSTHTTRSCCRGLTRFNTSIAHNPLCGIVDNACVSRVGFEYCNRTHTLSRVNGYSKRLHSQLVCSTSCQTPHPSRQPNPLTFNLCATTVFHFLTFFRMSLETLDLLVCDEVRVTAAKTEIPFLHTPQWIGSCGYMDFTNRCGFSFRWVRKGLSVHSPTVSSIAGVRT
jgi:hypothetical protein